MLTNPWHERDTRRRVERLGAPVRVPPPDTQEDLMQKSGVTAGQAAGGSPDVRWLLDGDAFDARLYLAGDQLPVGAEVFPGREDNDDLLWIERHRAVIAGDSLVDFGRAASQ